MIIERWEFKIKPGCLEEAKNLILSMDWGRPYKLHESEMGELYRLTSFIEFERCVNHDRWRRLRLK